jgi:hypothetical protein
MTVKIDGTNTEANPAFTGADTDTGLQCGTNELKLVTGGTARATVDSEGKTTIQGSGTSNNPFEILTLKNTETSSSGQSIQLNLETNRNSQQGTSKIKSVASDNSGTALLQFNSSQYRLKNQANTLTYATIDSDGLKFNADTAAVNALDDYEEGTWSPGVVLGTCSATNAKYIKVGNFVKVCAVLDTFSDRSSFTILQVDNVPYASNHVAQAAGSMFGRYSDRTAYTTHVKTNGGVIEFYSIGSGNFAPLQHQHLNNANAQLYLQASWIIN